MKKEAAPNKGWMMFDTPHRKDFFSVNVSADDVEGRIFDCMTMFDDNYKQ